MQVPQGGLALIFRVVYPLYNCFLSFDFILFYSSRLAQDHEASDLPDIEGLELG